MSSNFRGPEGNGGMDPNLEYYPKRKDQLEANIITAATVFGGGLLVYAGNALSERLGICGIAIPAGALLALGGIATNVVTRLRNRGLAPDDNVLGRNIRNK